MRGQPDYGGSQQKAFGVTLSDMADLAVRLGSIVEYDRRGDIVFLDDFEGPLLKWGVTVVGASSAVLDSSRVLSGSQGVKLTVVAGLGSLVDITRAFASLGVPRIGGKIGLCDLSVGLDFYLALFNWDGANGYRARILYDDSLGSFFAEDTVAGNWTLIADVGGMQRGTLLFYPMKLVADFVTNRYVRLLFGNTEYDLSAIAIPPRGGAGASYFTPSMMLYNPGVGAGNAWIDDFVMTQNEP